MIEGLIFYAYIYIIESLSICKIIELFTNNHPYEYNFALIIMKPWQIVPNVGRKQ